MKPILPFALALLFSSCTHYQYLTVAGVNIEKNQAHQFVNENDSLRVVYNFSDYRGKVAVTVFNKLDEPLEIDWRRSALVVDGKATSFYTPRASFEGTIEKDTLSDQRRLALVGDPLYLASLNGSLLITEPTQFLPPRSSVRKASLELLTQQLPNLSREQFKPERIRWASEVYVEYGKLGFSKEKTPLSFRSYLTFRVGFGPTQKQFAVEHSFYISEIWQTAAGPADFPPDSVGRGDRFFLQP